MSGRMTLTVDGTPVSDADIERMRAEEELQAEWQRRTVRVVAAAASDAEDCRMLLSILGLDREIVAEARGHGAAHAEPQSRASKPARRSAPKASAAKRSTAKGSTAKGSTAKGSTAKGSTAKGSTAKGRSDASGKNPKQRTHAA